MSGKYEPAPSEVDGKELAALSGITVIVDAESAGERQRFERLTPEQGERSVLWVDVRCRGCGFRVGRVEEFNGECWYRGFRAIGQEPDQLASEAVEVSDLSARDPEPCCPRHGRLAVTAKVLRAEVQQGRRDAVTRLPRLNVLA